jgi:hypothetical protein
MSATIEFKGKVKRVSYSDGSGYDYIQIPEFDRKHCDMNAFRSHVRYGSYANSDLFKGPITPHPNGEVRQLVTTQTERDP